MRRGILQIVFLVLCFFPPLYLHASQENTVIEMTLKRVMLDPYSKMPVVILEDIQEKKIIPIWIGKAEATSIAMELEHVEPPRPLTHDLIRNILQGIGVVLQHITVTDLRNNIYYASITLKLNGQEFQIDSRPSDAIAVALRMKAPIFASSQVLAKARQLPFPDKPRGGFRKIMGIHVQPLTLELARLFDIQVKEGVLVADVELGSTASEAGMQRGDIILKLNDRMIHEVGDLESFFQGAKKPIRVKIEVLRKGKTTPLVLDLPS